MAVITASVTPAAHGLRPIDPGRDLSAITDLVDRCFAGALDPDGQRYLHEMRTAARLSQMWSWFSELSQPAGLPLTGYVWEEDGRLIGNVSVISFNHLGQRCHLIANVAVHPDYRNRGIGRALTVRAIEHARQHRSTFAWLQVRHDNPPAVHIYQALGFQERARRTTWVWEARSSQAASEPATDRTLIIGPRCPHHWPVQQQWLQRLYPNDVLWHLPLKLALLEPGLAGSMQRLLAFIFPRHWVALRDNKMAGVVAWQRSYTYADTLWLAAPESSDDQAIAMLLLHTRRQLARSRPLALNYPAGLSATAIQSAGFSPQSTLIWMALPC
jgi:GNAT superfamily N-acetyltransferase